MTLKPSRANLTFEPFTDAYKDLATFRNVVEPEYPVTANELRHWYENRDPKTVSRRFVLYDQSRIVAAGELGQNPWMYHPKKFYLDVSVHPEVRSRGIGGALFDHLTVELVAFDPLLVRAQARENRPAALHFVQKRGFTEETREWESRLALDTFEAEDVALQVEDITFKTLKELTVTDPDHRRKLFGLEFSAGADAPYPDAPTQPDFTAWQKTFFERPNFTPEAHLVALSGDEYVGMNSLNVTENEEGVLYNGLTGVRREYRRRGIARALKVKNLLWAKRNGYEVVKTWNDATNEGMLELNIALGFVKQPAWIGFKKVLREEGSA